MGPGEELARKLVADRVALDETGEQPLAEQPHHGFGVPALERVKGAVAGETSIRDQQVPVRMPLGQIPSRRDGDDDSRPPVRAEPSLDVLGDGVGRALGEVEEELPTLAEDPAQEAGHREHDVATRHGREHPLL